MGNEDTTMATNERTFGPLTWRYRKFQTEFGGAVIRDGVIGVRLIPTLKYVILALVVAFLITVVIEIFGYDVSLVDNPWLSGSLIDLSLLVIVLAVFAGHSWGKRKAKQELARLSPDQVLANSDFQIRVEDVQDTKRKRWSLRGFPRGVLRLETQQGGVFLYGGQEELNAIRESITREQGQSGEPS